MQAGSAREKGNDKHQLGEIGEFLATIEMFGGLWAKQLEAIALLAAKQSYPKADREAHKARSPIKRRFSPCCTFPLSDY